MDQNNNVKKGKMKEGFASAMKKASEFAKKATEDMKQSANSLSEKTKQSLHDQKTKKYNPLFMREFSSADFKLPNVIEIVDDAIRRDVDVCEGAIGWTDKVNDVEILHLYDEWVKESQIQFVPFPKCDAIYCVDPFDRNKFISSDSIFEQTRNEKLAELEHIAYCLGAKSCSIEIVEAKIRKVSDSAFRN